MKLELGSNMDPWRKGLMTLLGCLLTLLLPQKFVTKVGATGSPPVREYNISGILNSLQVGYDKRVRPNYGGPPVSVEISMLILSISSLSEVQMDFTLDFYFRQYWKDPRMEFPHQPGIEVLSVSTDYLQHIWVPDTFFANEKTSYFHMATTSNEFLRIKYDGQIQRSIRLTITATCPMNLKFFPMDRQLCAVEVESFGLSLKDIIYKWIDSPKAVAVEPEVELPQFKIMGFRKTSRVITTSTGNYSRLACQIQFVRSMGYYLIQIYIPSSLIVVISWVSFWLNRTASPARVSLGVTTVLTMTTLMSSTNAALPKISYIKSIDIFLGTCFVMVFASLLEYATVGYLAKRIEMKKKHYQNLQKLVEQHRAAMADTEASSSTGARGGDRGKTGGGLDEEAALALLAPHAKNLNQMYGITPSDIDKYSRVVFPVFFTCFHLVYWNVYLHISDVVADDLIPHVV